MRLEWLLLMLVVVMAMLWLELAALVAAETAETAAPKISFMGWKNS